MHPDLENSVPAAFDHYRRVPMDGSLLLFDRATGNNVLLDGNETAEFKAEAPRVVQFGITNACNLACGFCSRDLEAASSWTEAEAFRWLAALDRLGVIEVAFGGGEPLLFRGFETLVQRLHEETRLAVHFTTNGLLLDEDRIERLARWCQECRISIYDDNRWRQTLNRLAGGSLRFGVNYLVTPERLPDLDDTVMEIVGLGCRDVLLLSYNGNDFGMHLGSDQIQELDQRIRRLRRALRGRCELKLDVCWGERLATIPRLFEREDCGAGRDFVVLTSDKRVMPCSFHDLSFPVNSPNELMRLWAEARADLVRPSCLAGCARVKNCGLEDRPLAAPTKRRGGDV